MLVIRMGFDAALSMFQPDEFDKISINDFFYGRDNSFVKAISAIKWDFSSKNTGFLTPRNGQGKQVLTVSKEGENAGMIMEIDASESLNIWKNEKCNRVNVSDGIVYDPQSLKIKGELFSFVPTFCISLPLDFVEEVSV
jgi:hypothetical protein